MKLYSATEVDAARGCLRKWAFGYASDVPRLPPGPGAALGSEGHAIVEAYLKDGKAPTDEGLGSLVRAALPYLPAPGSGDVEVRSTVTIEGLPFVRVLDWTGKVADLPGVDEGARSIAEVAQLDHKFSKDPRRYGLWTDEDFLGNVQTLVYRVSEGNRPVFQRWLYYPTSGARRPKPSDHLLTYGQATESFKRIVLPVIASMEPYRGSKVDPNGVPGNPGHCDAYGGCGYMKAGLCSMTRGQVTTNYFQGDDDMPTVPDNSIWKRLPLNGGPAAASAPAAPAQMIATAPAVPVAAPGFTFNFPAQPPAAPAAPLPVPEIPSAVSPLDAPTDPATPPEKPKKTRAPKAETAPTTPASSYEALNDPGDDTLARIGRAMIAAGKVLAGE